MFGLFQAKFSLEPVAKQGTFLMSPEAIGREGQLRRNDPATTGMEILLCLKRKGSFEDELLNTVPEDVLPNMVALPKEVRVETTAGCIETDLPADRRNIG